MQEEHREEQIGEVIERPEHCEENHAPISQEKTQKPLMKMFAGGIVSVFVLAAVAGLVLEFNATRNLSSNPTVVRVAKYLGISVAKVDGISISYADYMEDLGILKKFYSNPDSGLPAEGDEAISDQVLSRLVVSSLIQQYADKYNVAVSDEEVQKSPELAQLIAPFGSRESAEKEMLARYGLTFDKYVQKVVYPVLLEKKLQEAIAISTDDIGKKYEEDQARASHILLTVDDPKEDAKVKQEAEKVLARAKKGEDFAALAKEFGSDGTKDIGGDLGWFGRGRMVKEFEDAVFAGEEGKLVPKLVKTEFGYHIVKVDGKRKARNYSAFMGDQLRLAKIEITIPKLHNPFAQAEKTSAAAK